MTERPLRVLYVHHMAAMGGAEHSLRLLIRNVDRSRVVPLFAGPPGPLPDDLARLGVSVVPLAFGRVRNLPEVLRSARSLAGLIRREGVDLLHSNGPQTNIPASLAGRLTGVPAVWHARNLPSPGMWDIDRMLAPLATRIICNADAIRERFRGSRGWTKAVTIMSAVDLDEFNPDVSGAPVRRELGIADDAQVVGLVGRLGPGKGHDVFVEAAIRLIGEGVRARFLVVGATLFASDHGPEAALRRRIREAGVGAAITLTGFRRDIPRVMRALDVMVLASDAEPCGRVLFEAMASGTAIVATNTGGTPEIVGDDGHGLLVPPRDPAALARAIGRLLDDPELRRRLGESGADRARRSFGVNAHVNRIVTEYETLLGRRAGRYADAVRT